MHIAPRLILVTGSAGWLGRCLVRALHSGLAEYPELREGLANTRFRCWVRPGEDASELLALGSRIECFEGDLRNARDCQRFCEGAQDATLYHLAGIIHPERVRDFYELHVDATRAVLTAAARSGVRRAVIVSSNSPCGVNPHPDHFFDETSPYRPWMHYGRSKMEMELLARDISRDGQLETVIVRPPWFYGPRQPARQTEFFRMIESGRAPVVGSGENLRSMVYLENLAYGLMLAGTKPEAAGETYWIADERPYSMNEIIDTVERLQEQEFGRRVAHRRLRMPRIAGELAVWMDRGIQATGLYHAKIHVLGEMHQTIACHIGKAREHLGYRPAIGLEEGMRRSLAWLYREELGRRRLSTRGEVSS